MIKIKKLDKSRTVREGYSNLAVSRGASRPAPSVGNYVPRSKKQRN